MFSRRTTQLGSLFAAVALVAAACGSTAATNTTAAPIDDGASVPAADAEANAPADGAGSPAADTNDASPAVASDLPSVDVLDVRTGDTVNLATLVPRDKPVLLWFYAPH